MKKLLILILLILLNANLVFSDSIDSEIKKVTNYAEDFEVGNINYVQLLVYSSAVREEMNGILGVTDKEFGGILKEEQLKSALGAPTERTRWIWDESKNKEIKLDKEVPAWRKIIFDGEKIQIWISSWPSILKKSEEEILVYRLNFEINFKEPEEKLNMESRISKIKILAENFNKDQNKKNAEALAEESVNAERTFEMYMRQNAEKCEAVMKSLFGTENKREAQEMIVQEIEFYEGENFEVKARLEMCDECEWKWTNLNLWVNGRGPGFKMPKDKPQEFSPDQFQNLDFSDYEEKISETLDEIKSNLKQGDYKRIFSLNNKIQAINEAWNQKANNVWPEVDKMFDTFDSLTQEEQSKLEEYWWIKQEQQKREKVKEIVDKNYQKRKRFYLDLFSSYEKEEFHFEQIEYEKRLVEEFKEFGKEKCDNNIDDNKNDKVDCSDNQCSGKICGKQKVSVQKENETIEEEKDLFCIEGTCQLKEEVLEIKISVCGNHICEENEQENCVQDCSLCQNYTSIECSGRVIFKGVDENKCPLEPICLNETNSCEKNEDCAQPLCGKAECVASVCRTIELEECKEAECNNSEEKIQNCFNGDKIIIGICQEGLWQNTRAECEIPTGENESIEELIIIDEPILGNECVVKEDCGNENDVCSNGQCVTLPGTIEQLEVGIEEEQEFEEPEQIVESEESEEEESEESEEEGTESIEQQDETPLLDEKPKEEFEEPEQIVESEHEEDTEEVESEEQPEQTTVTGNVILSLKEFTGKITGFVTKVTGFDVEEPAQEENEEEEEQETEKIEPTEEIKEPEQIVESEPEEDTEEVESGGEQNKQQEERRESEREEKQDEDQDRREREHREDEERKEEEQRRIKEEKERRENECKNNCDRECKNRLIAPCVSECVRNSQCQETSCVDEEIIKCEADCKEELGFDKCTENCIDNCIVGKHLEIKTQEEENKEEKTVFKAGGTCRTSQGNKKIESFIFFDGWGEPFKQIQPLKQKYYASGDDWCKKELDNLLKQRREFEKGLDQEFVTWFFEKYLANSANEWEQHVSGIFELYWKDVELSKQIAEKLDCLDTNKTPQYDLVNVKYETDYGKLELWEEIKKVKLPGFENEVEVISPYMKVWVFPPKSFIIYEMKNAMEKHEFPGSPEEKLERKNEGGPTEEEKEFMKQDEEFMKQIRKISKKYEGNVDAVVKFVDEGQIVFNLYVQVNENDIIKVTPMLPTEVPQEDVSIEIDFQKLYDIIAIQEKEMQGGRIESPPWDKKVQPMQKIKEITSGIKTAYKIWNMINSAKISPETSEDDVQYLMGTFFKMMIKSEKKEPKMENKDIEVENGIWEDKEKITGES